jgi:hypothetical protein
VATTLAQIMVDAKDLSDLVSNPIVSDPTWRRWINQGQERLYRLLVTKAPARFHKSATFTLTGLGGNTVALASDFRQLREGGVTKDPTVPSLRHTLRRFSFGERDAQGQLPAWGAGRELAYDIQGGNIVVEPEILSAGNYAYYYLVGPVAWATDGSQDSTAIAAVFGSYVDFIAHWAAIKGLTKEESTETAQVLKADLRDLAEEIQAEFNEGSDPATIIDVAQVGGIFWP